MLVDTHCHIHDRETYDFAINRQQISKKLLALHPETPHEKADFTPKNLLHRAKLNSVGKIITVGTSHPDSIAARDFAAKYKNIFWSYGIHPDEADGHYGEFPDNIKKLVAIGEIGLDYHNGTDQQKRQIDLLERMLSLAAKHNLPCIFHVREAFDDFFAVVDNFPDIKRAVIHSFSDSPKNLEKSLSRGFFIGVNGLATFADLYPENHFPPLDRTLLETDAPFLAPVPVRGHVNEPAYIKNIAEFLAKRQHLSLAEIASVTTKNAEFLFQI